MALSKKVTRWVCKACGGVWFQANALNRCPSCNGEGGEKSGELQPDGSFKADG